jgi:hypothetical protein
MLLVDDVQPVNTVVRNVLDCPDNVVERMEWRRPKAVEWSLAEFGPMTSQMSRKHPHQTGWYRRREYRDSDVSNTVQPEEHIWSGGGYQSVAVQTFSE